MSEIPSFCGSAIIGSLAALGVGSLVATIAKTSGLKSTLSTLAGWIAAMFYELILVGTIAIGLWVNDSFLNEISGFMFFILLIIGIIGWVVKLWLRSRHPDLFRKSTPGQVASTSPVQGTIDLGHLRRAEISEPVTPPVTRRTVEASPGHIFVSYRRSDSADIAGRIYDRLVDRFGRAPIFKDVDSIPLGLDFKKYLEQKVGECDVLLAIIGDHWLDARDSAGNRRLYDPDDFVRIEIQSALERGIPVVPLLVRDAHMPRVDHLPVGLQKLVYRNGIPIRPDPDFHRDMDRLISSLEKYVRQKK